MDSNPEAIRTVSGVLLKTLSPDKAQVRTLETFAGPPGRFSSQRVEFHVD